MNSPRSDRTGAQEAQRRRTHGNEVPKLTGIVGSPAQTASSLSPVIHNAAFRALNMDWLYLCFGLEADTAVPGIRGLAAGGVKGMNVTLPHKVTALEAMDVLSESAARIGALNTIEVRAGSLVGWNTDGEGLVRFLTLDAGAKIEGSEVLVIGAGGSARAVIYALAQAGASVIRVLARDPSRAAALEPLSGETGFKAGSLEAAGSATIAGADIIVNATPVGQGGELFALPTESISPHAVVVDLVYRPPVTPLIKAAREQGAVAHSGLGMLLHQAALAFQIWTGILPPMDVMSAAAVAGIKQTPDSPERSS